MGPTVTDGTPLIPLTVPSQVNIEQTRGAFGLGADELARVVGVDDGRTVRRWEFGERELPGPVTVVMETALGYLRKIQDLLPPARTIALRKNAYRDKWNGRYDDDY